MAVIISSSSVLIFLISGASAIVERKSSNKIGVVELTGVIMDSSKIVSELKTFRERKDIKAVVLRINSPGGGVAPSQEIHEAVKKLALKKKVVSSFGSVAASGGYYSACGSDAIFANPGTITGSIGVIMEYTNLKKIMDKIGLTPVVIKSGKFKDIGSPTRAMTREEKAYLQSFIDGIHDQFIRAVSEGRHLPVKKVRKYADGRIFSGEDALKIGLIDKIGSFEDALDYASFLSGIKNKDYDVEYPPKKKLFFLKEFLEESVSKISEVIFNRKISYIMQ